MPETYTPFQESTSARLLIHETKIDHRIRQLGREKDSQEGIRREGKTSKGATEEEEKRAIRCTTKGLRRAAELGQPYHVANRES